MRWSNLQGWLAGMDAPDHGEPYPPEPDPSDRACPRGMTPVEPGSSLPGHARTAPGPRHGPGATTFHAPPRDN